MDSRDMINSTPDKEDVSTAVAREINNLKTKLTDEGKEFLSGMTTMISSAAGGAIDEATTKIQGYINECGDELTEEAAEVIKGKVQEYTDSFVNSTMKLSGNSSASADNSSWVVSIR